jgi:hypothetical protein
MTPNQKKYYLLGLQDAINEIDLEIKYAKDYPLINKHLLEQHIISCRICKAGVETLVEAVSNNL